jgi:hypothetical protein
MNTCKDCKFWVLKKDFEGTTLPLNSCLSEKIKLLEYGMTLGYDELGYSDFKKHGAYFITGMDFGCIHFINRWINNDK